MPILKEQISEILAEKKNNRFLREAVDQQDRLLFHTENVNRNSAPRYLAIFLEKVRSLLTEDKQKTFIKLMDFPLDTTKTVDEVYRCLAKVFDGVDPIYRLIFRSDSGDLQGDALQYLEDQFGFPQELRNYFYRLFKTSINSVLVVGLPEEQDSTRPEPFVYDVDISQIIEFDEDERGNFNYLIYKKDAENYCIIDDESYRIFNLTNGAVDITEQTEHNLGMCPVTWFWNDKLGNCVTANSPLSMYLGSLDDLLFEKTNTKYAKLYAAYPIYWGYSGECTFEDADTECHEGYLKNKTADTYLRKAGQPIKCPSCNNKVGVGTYISVPFPDGEDIPAIKAPVGKLDADVKGIKMLREDVMNLEKEIYKGITNDLYNPSDYEAMNETQIMSIFDGAEQTLLTLQKHFEHIEKWVINTCLKIRYQDAFDHYYVSYGTKHYVFSADVLLMAYNKGLRSGFSETILDSIYQKYLEAEHKDNPRGYRRAKIMFELEPFRHSKRDEVLSLVKEGVIDKSEAYMKINFSSLISRFERENGSLEVFGSMSDQPMRQLIESIRARIQTYLPVVN